MESPKKPALLTIAGFDPTGGAGILTDAAVFRTLGFHPLTVLTSIAAQGAAEVREIHPLPGEFIARELDIIAEEFDPAAVKIGMLYHREAIEAAAAFLTKSGVKAVLDPVIKASSGGDLMVKATIPLLEEAIFPLCTVITPNLAEAEYFLQREISDASATETAATELSKRWHCAVLLKGGHLPDQPTDYFASESFVTSFPHQRIDTEGVPRGTGCALSATITAGLARGRELVDAVGLGIQFVAEAIKTSYQSGRHDDVRFLDLSMTKFSGTD